MIRSSEAIVLNTKKYGDSSKIVSLYTKEDGKINLIAKAARAAKNKYGASLEPMSMIYATYYKKPARGLSLISSAELIIRPKGVTSSLELMAAAMGIIETIGQTQEEDEANHELFALIFDSLNTLNEAPEKPYHVFLAFLVNLCRIMGFELAPGAASAVAGQYVYFSINAGCPASTHEAGQHLVRISPGLFNILWEISLPPLQAAAVTAVTNNILGEALSFFSKYFSFHLEKLIHFRSFELVLNQPARS